MADISKIKLPDGTTYNIKDANAVTGSGTSGYIAKFDGTNTITNGPAIGTSITNFLAENGQWRQPANDKVRQNYYEDTSDKYYMPLLGEHDLTYSQYSQTEDAGTRKAIGLTYCIKDGMYRKLTISATDGGGNIRSIELRPVGSSTIPSLTSNSISSGDIYSEGEIETETNLRANKVFCNSMSVTDISDQYTITRRSGNWYPVSLEAWRSGNIVQMRIIFRGNGSAVGSGSNGVIGSISGGPLPLMTSQLIGYGDARVISGAINDDGSYDIRNTSTTEVKWTTASRVGVATTFIAND